MLTEETDGVSGGGIEVSQAKSLSRRDRSSFSLSPSLQDHGVGSTGHGMQRSMLQGRDASIGRQGIEQIDLVESHGVRKKTKEMIHILRRKLVAQHPCVPELPSQLSGCLAEVTQERFHGLGIGASARGPDDGVDRVPCSRSKEGKEGVKALALRW